MSTSATGDAPAETGQELHLVRWTVTSGSNIQSRGAVIIESGDHQWEASAEGNGPIDALYRAVERAIADVLAGHPRLLAYDIHALAEEPDAEGLVTVRIAPPPGEGPRATGDYAGEARSTNIIAASIEAYIQALNRLLAEAHWAGATDAAGNRKRAQGAAEAAEAGSRDRASLDPDEGQHDTTSWFNR